LECQGTQEDQKQMHTPELLPNPKIRIMTIFNQYRDKAARLCGTLHYSTPAVCTARAESIIVGSLTTKWEED
jgi:hypothetical protein